MSSVILAKRKNNPFDMAMNHIWVSFDGFYTVGNYVLIHFMDNSKMFGDHCVSCQNITDLNDVKSTILNNGFSIDWNVFDFAMKHLNGGVNNNISRIETLQTQVANKL